MTSLQLLRPQKNLVSNKMTEALTADIFFSLPAEECGEDRSHSHMACRYELDRLVAHDN